MKLIGISGGHHIQAKGASNAKYHLNEYDEMQKVIPHLGDYLISKGFAVIEASGTLGQKIAIFNSKPCLMVVDCHLNADAELADTDNTKGQGIEVLHMPYADAYSLPEPESIRRRQARIFAQEMNLYMQSRLRGQGATPGWYWGARTLDKNGLPTVKDAFLRTTNCPAFIPEPGFIDNNGFAEQWLLAGRHSQLAEAIGCGIIAVAELLVGDADGSQV